MAPYQNHLRKMYCLHQLLFLTSLPRDIFNPLKAIFNEHRISFPEVPLHLYYLLIWTRMEYCCHYWAGIPSCYLDMLAKLQKRICRTTGPSLTTSLEPLAHLQNVASLSLFHRYHFGKCSSELAQLRERSTGYSDRLQYFSVIIPRCYKDVLYVIRMSMSTASFLAQLESVILCLYNDFL